jgi:hypothetical protein
MWRAYSRRRALQISGDAQWAVSDAWWREHGSAHEGRLGAVEEGGMEARRLFR